MGAIEPARQAGSTDTKLDHQLDHDGFAVGILRKTKLQNIEKIKRLESDSREKLGSEAKKGHTGQFSIFINCT